MKGKILIVDDLADFRKLLRDALEDNYTITEADSKAALEKAFAQEQPDLVLLDVKLPDGNGLDLLPVIKKRWPETEVIVLTGAPDDKEALSWAVEATKRGAFNFIRKSAQFDFEKLLADVDNALERRQQTEETSMLRRALETMSGTASPIFQSPAMREVVRTVERIAPSDVAVLITGESGTGKEVIADLIHAFSPRSKGKIIKINCAALPRELIESELFGSVKGAFTGAHTDREGLFRQAEGGTLLLDEISEMPIDTQSKLLRVLQDQEVRPVGGKTSYKTNCRLVASTNRKTDEAISQGKLREDLFYRISAISVHLPPLRERREDIMPLANRFLKRFAAQANRVIKGFTASRGGAVDRVRLARQRAPVAERSAARGAPVRRRHGGRERSVRHEPAGPPARAAAIPTSPCWKESSAAPSSRCSRKPAATSWKPPNASASAARRSTTRSRLTGLRCEGERET